MRFCPLVVPAAPLCPPSDKLEAGFTDAVLLVTPLLLRATAQKMIPPGDERVHNDI